MLLLATEMSPAAEAVLTTWQAPPCFSMRGTKARMPWATPMRFTPSTHCHSSAVVVHAGPQTATPALLNSRCTAPKRAYASAARLSTSDSFDTSQRTARLSAAPMSRVVSAIPGSSTSASATRMPSRAQASASSRPMPLPPPVTTATLPRRSSNEEPSIDHQRGAGREARRVRGEIEDRPGHLVGLRVAPERNLRDALFHRGIVAVDERRRELRVGEPGQQSVHAHAHRTALL